jgi:hypothetical protein
MLGDAYLRSCPRYWDRLSPDQQRSITDGYDYPSVVQLANDLDFRELLLWQIVHDLGGDILAGVTTVRPEDDHVRVQISRDREGQTRFEYETPWGSLDEVVAASGSAETSFRTIFPIADRQDYAILSQVVTQRRYTARYERFERTENALGERGACYVTGPDQPLVSLFRVRDPAQLLFDIADEPAQICALLGLLHERATEAYRLVAQGPGHAVLTGMAFMTTQLISPRIFDEYVLPFLAEYARILHQAGKILLCHMCGHVRRLLPMLRQAGVDGVESLTNPPIGDTTLEDYWKIMGDRAILIGGIDAGLLLRGSPAELQAHGLDVLERMRGHPHILGTADEVPYGTPEENLLAVARIAQRGQVG